MPTTKSPNNKAESKRRLIVFVAAVVMIAALVAGIYLFGKQKKDTPEDTTASASASTAQQTTLAPTTSPEAISLINPLTGIAGLSDTATGKRPVAVVVENSPQARPQWGLCSPDIVIEGVVEAGITRMLWLYADVNTIPKVGPVRSARHDFVEMAEGLDAIFVHWGWSNIAESAITARNVDHIDGMNGVYFFRDTKRKVDSEHTGYTNGESISKAINDKKFNTQIDSSYAKPFEFVSNNAPATPTGGNCKSLSFEFSPGYKHEFKYVSADKLFYNYLNANPMLQDGGNQMAVTNVIILYCPVSVADATGHMEMDLTGGTGVYASNGGFENITWKKSNTPGAMLTLFAPDGSGLQLNPGKSYIGFVPTAQKGNTVISAG